RAVGTEGAVGPDGCGHDFRSRFPSQAHAEAHRLLAIQAALREPFEAELVRGRGGDIRAGGHVGLMDLANQQRIFQQQFGRPERIAQVGTPPFQFGGQAAVENDRAETESLPERHTRKTWCHGPLPSCWIQGVSATNKRLPCLASRVKTHGSIPSSLASLVAIRTPSCPV